MRQEDHEGWWRARQADAEMAICAHKARQCQTTALGQVGLPEWCEENAPQDINCYSDGSWRHSMFQWTGIGAGGVFWPKRKLAGGMGQVDEVGVPVEAGEGGRTSVAEQELAHITQDRHGVYVTARVGGLGGSSTRTEIAGAILALAAPGAVHIGTDSAAFRNKALRLLRNVRREGGKKWNWAMHKNGDLWAHFDRSVRAKGAHAIFISKVKGHATAADIAEGRAREVDQFGNDKADGAAKGAVQQHGKAFVACVAKLFDRQKAYNNFVFAVIKHLLERYSIHRQLTEKAEAAGMGVKRGGPKVGEHVGYEPGPRVAAPCDTPSTLTGHHAWYPKLGGDKWEVASVWAYVDNVGLIDPAAHTDPDAYTTWLELYVWYRLNGGARPVPKHARKARSTKGVAKQVHRFRQIVLGVVRQAMPEATNRERYRPWRGHGQAHLRGVALDGTFPAINAVLNVTIEERRRIDEALVRLGRKVTQDKANDFLTGVRPLPLSAPSLGGRGCVG